VAPLICTVDLPLICTPLGNPSVRGTVDLALLILLIPLISVDLALLISR
jgi:hypothetical protein